MTVPKIKKGMLRLLSVLEKIKKVIPKVMIFFLFLYGFLFVSFLGAFKLGLISDFEFYRRIIQFSFVFIIIFLGVIQALLAFITSFKRSTKNVVVAITHGTIYTLIIVIIWHFVFK